MVYCIDGSRDIPQWIFPIQCLQGFRSGWGDFYRRLTLSRLCCNPPSRSRLMWICSNMHLKLWHLIDRLFVILLFPCLPLPSTSASTVYTASSRQVPSITPAIYVSHSFSIWKSRNTLNLVKANDHEMYWREGEVYSPEWAYQYRVTCLSHLRFLKRLFLVYVPMAANIDLSRLTFHLIKPSSASLIQPFKAHREYQKTTSRHPIQLLW